MTEGEALRAAIDLFYLPSQIRIVRRQPLPKGTGLLLRLAVGDPSAANEAKRHSGRSIIANREAAVFFVEQILLRPDADEYTILGLDHTAEITEFRAHMALLLKWLHPDMNSDENRSLMACRVIDAWNKVKSLDRNRRQQSEPGTSILQSQNRFNLSRTPIGWQHHKMSSLHSRVAFQNVSHLPPHRCRLLRILKSLLGYTRTNRHSAQQSGK
ncbi:MAG TPA: J domain-containing protein [Hyphomicrobium sp.]|jgi:hypothetical protein|nr:hypothetical protein [Rhizomicrobium sp.]HVX35774.1 J domain-containing protein [Hyphomicrobium sp.]